MSAGGMRGSRRSSGAISAMLFVVLFGTVLAVGGCGKKGSPSPPGPPDQITYPRAYPTH